MSWFSHTLKRDISVVRQWLHGLDEHEKLLFLAIFAYIIYFTLASFLRYDNFYTGRFDLGNMVQAVWNTAQGRIFAVTDPDRLGITSRLAFHADFFLIFLAPFYLLWPSPKLLLLVQTVIVGLGALFVYKLATHILHRKTISLALAASYLLNPSVERSNLYDFHAVVLATTFLLGAFYFMKQRRYGWFLLFAFLAGSTKEEVWAIIGLLGLFILARALYAHRSAMSQLTEALKREALFGMIVFAGGFSLFYLFFSVIIPAVHGQQHFAVTYFSDFGDKPTGIVKGILTSPSKVFMILFEASRKSYLRQLFLPLGYLSVFSPLYLLFALPDLTINLLSNNTNFHQIYYQYTATITPFLYIAAIYGIRLIRYFFQRISLTIITAYLVIMTLYGAYLYGPLPFAKEKNISMFSAKRLNNEKIDTFLRTIPVDATITSNNQLGSHLSERERIYTLPLGIDKADYVLFLLSDSTAQPSMKANRFMADTMLNNPEYILIYREGDFLAFKKNRLSTLLR